VIEIEGAIKLMMWLPGDIAKQNRAKFTSILKRYLAGDRSLIKEIKANAASDAPIHKFTRASMAASDQSSGSDVEDDVCIRKRKRMMMLDDIEIEERRSIIQMRIAEAKKCTAEALKCEAEAKICGAEAKKCEIEAHNMNIEGYVNMCPNKVIDDKARIMFKDAFMNISANNANQKAITNGEVNSTTTFLTISNEAVKLGLIFSSGELISIGREIVKRYKEKYSTDAKPTKHEQSVGGGVRPVCTYDERDKDIIHAVLHEFAAKKK
jgi:hypothetical protein